ncbi:glycoside hydrolase family 15 protein [Linderina pennispora]|uniref:Glycoside hydrolase family 15 protein n=1 Tax=Linderina pennispora TaxID=61395 RepID=A0A1Y1W9C2_9FUNG|nr:glycoside hydrolase family 15 protein [Linderina pennispora]ORX69985.1 glycoside hydrolase family 15 protein [Linderina pennispora]
MRKPLNGYLPIENYGIIGNMHTTALVGLDGSVDFLCWPEFDSPSVFCRMLDKTKGGHFSITPTTPDMSSKQQYLPFSNVLVTKFLSEAGVGQVTDYMHRPKPGSRSHSVMLPWLIRSVDVIRGELEFSAECFPAFDYARAKHKMHIDDTEHDHMENAEDVAAQTAVHPMDLRYVVGASAGCHGMGFDWQPVDNPNGLGQGVQAKFRLQEGQRVTFIFRTQPEPNTDFIDPPLSMPLLDELLEDTLMYWLMWIRKCKYSGRWLEHVERSALMLKLLTYEPTGAVVAAPSFSLPEAIGDSGRNWDYRFTWVRDSAFTMYAFMRLGLTTEAKKYMEFVSMLCREKKNPDGSLQIMYTLRGGREMPELILPHLEGYRECAPVRIGNGAADHIQLDIYGELLDAIYLYNKYANPLSYDDWVEVRTLVTYVCNNYDQPDMGIWEVRGQRQHFTYSKVQCWVAVDRGLRLVDKRDFPCPDQALWSRTRDKIYEEIMQHAWNPEMRIFTQSYEHKEMLDAAVLAMPLVFFCAATDPRFVSTLNRIMLPPHKGGLSANNLVFRYNAIETDDGLSGEEGAFSLCTFWLAEALARASPANKTMLYKSQVIVEEMITYGNHVGLFSEEIDKAGKHLGNFPQAFTHIALISAAFNVDRELKKVHN